ncbi:hypothetical protein BJ138DRAFT_1118274 [Hygrophoropsis aurantiaca]|uniref:Uncharacterized protein n=1 Tax=Hygrophoropsis aurantiaca TaxID=72124 RepID=A0ACB7ZZ77_9AGAM|nr:hypothetical protein BJ138DRAFT_1118274 [Hygrophoropsis aurantiaca]
MRPPKRTAVEHVDDEQFPFRPIYILSPSLPWPLEELTPDEINRNNCRTVLLPSPDPLIPRARSVSRSVSLRFTGNKDICRIILEKSALPEIIAMGHTCTDLRPVAFLVAQQRFLSLMSAFFPDRVQEFASILHCSKGIISGSIALAMLLGATDIHPQDLNIIIPYGRKEDLTNWLVDNDYRQDESYAVHPALTPCIHTFECYVVDDSLVTISECNCSDVFDVIVNSPTTADMTLITAGGVITLYPDFTLAHHTIRCPGGKFILTEEEPLGCFSNQSMPIHKSASFLSTSCKLLCPMYWRHSRTDQSILCMDWDQRFSIRSILQNSNADWRISEKCTNKHCENNCTDIKKAADVFAVRQQPALIYHVNDIKDLMMQYLPRNITTYNGLLYGTLFTRAVIVPVPVTFGVQTPSSLFHLDVDHWIKQRGDHTYSAHRVHLHKTFKTIMSVPLDHSYTMFIDDPRLLPPYNVLANSIAPPREQELAFQGNILEREQYTTHLAPSMTPGSPHTESPNRGHPAGSQTIVSNVMGNAEICDILLKMCPLQDILALGHTCTNLRPKAWQASQKRFHSLLLPFFPTNATEFPAILQRANGVITGSTALAMLFDPATIPKRPNDLNLIVPKGACETISDWLTKNYYHKNDSYEAHRLLYLSVESFSTYSLGNRVVTISEAVTSDILSVVVNCLSTADMTIMTGGGIATLYPSLTLTHNSILSDGGEQAQLHEELLGSMSTGYVSVHRSSKFLASSCKKMCPSSWRHAGSDDAINIMHWDIRYPINRIIQQSNADWRIKKKCDNQYCSNHSATFDVTAEIFTLRPPPALIYDIEARVRMIEDHQPPHLLSIKGLLYATLCTKPSVVPVPTSIGVHNINSLFNLDVDYWVKQRGDHTNNANRAHLQKTFNTMPYDSSVPLDYSYTIFFEDPHTTPAYNTLANSIAPPQNRDPPYYGNILVVKHCKSDLGKLNILDASYEDADILNVILLR